MERTLTFTPPSKARRPDTHLPVAQSAGTVSGVSVKLVRGRKGSLEKLMAEICWGASGFCLWNSDMSLLAPLTSSDVSIRLPLCHILYNIQGTRVSLGRFSCLGCVPPHIL